MSEFETFIAWWGGITGTTSLVWAIAQHNLVGPRMRIRLISYPRRRVLGGELDGPTDELQLSRAVWQWPFNHYPQDGLPMAGWLEAANVGRTPVSLRRFAVVADHCPRTFRSTFRRLAKPWQRRPRRSSIEWTRIEPRRLEPHESTSFLLDVTQMPDTLTSHFARPKQIFIRGAIQSSSGRHRWSRRYEVTQLPDGIVWYRDPEGKMHMEEHSVNWQVRPRPLDDPGSLGFGRAGSWENNEQASPDA